MKKNKKLSKHVSKVIGYKVKVYTDDDGPGYIFRWKDNDSRYESFATNLDSETYSMLANAVSAYTQESEQLCSDCIIDQIVKDLAELRARL